MADRARPPVTPRPAFVPPRTPLESEVARLWQELFETGPLGLADDFFALGGDSLLALRMVVELRERLGLELPLESLLGGATVERVADVLSHVAPGTASPLFRFRAGAGLAPLIFIHSAGGSAFSYLEVARSLPPGRTIYGLQEPLALSGSAHTVEARAAIYCDLVRAAIPDGAVHLAGHSFGGLVAFEMSRQFAAAGRRPGVVALLDTAAPIVDGVRVEDELVVRLAEILDSSALGDGPVDPEAERRLWTGLARFASGRVASPAPRPRPGDGVRFGEIERFCRRHHFLPRAGSMGYVEVRRFLRSLRAALRSARSYAPGPYPGRVALFQAGESTSGSRADAAAWNNVQTAQWRALAGGGLDVSLIPGNHLDLLGPTHAPMLAARLAAALGDAHPGESAGPMEGDRGRDGTPAGVVGGGDERVSGAADAHLTDDMSRGGDRAQ